MNYELLNKNTKTNGHLEKIIKNNCSNHTNNEINIPPYMDQTGTSPDDTNQQQQRCATNNNEDTPSQENCNIQQTPTATTSISNQRPGGVEMRLKSPASALHSTPAIDSPTTGPEENYIKSNTLHTYHGRTTHYYRDEPKVHEVLSVKVKI